MDCFAPTSNECSTSGTPASVLQPLTSFSLPRRSMYEPTNVVSGRAAISEVAGKLLEQFGPTFAFVPEGIAVGHHGFGVLPWHAGPKDGPVAVTGADVAEIIEGKIARLWVMQNPPNA